MGLAVEREGNDEAAHPTLVLMHFLGGSGREWDEVVEHLDPAYPVLRVDMPGFGGSAGETGYSVAAMADAVHAAIVAAGLSRYVLVGHSMSAKVATVLARCAEDLRDAALAGVVLVAGSPPGPEPMTDEKRGGMIANLGGAPVPGDLEKARNYITKNDQRHFSEAVLARAAHEVLRMNRTAWVAWLEHGSREDWGPRVGVLTLPALVVAGEKDAALGPDGQREHMLPHLGNARLHIVQGCSHLVPMERPGELAQLLRDFLAGLPGTASVSESYRAFIASDRVALNTRALLEERMAGPAPTEGTLNALQQRTLRAVLARVLPQATNAPQAPNAVDLAGTILVSLAAGLTSGWRYDVLPPRLQAYREALDRLAVDDFANLDHAAQDKALAHLAASKGSVAARWFEDLRADAVAAYVAHPATLARMGYSGIGIGGAHTPHHGYVTLAANQAEPWEPRPAVFQQRKTVTEEATS